MGAPRVAQIWLSGQGVSLCLFGARSGDVASTAIQVGIGGETLAISRLTGLRICRVRIREQGDGGLDRVYTPAQVWLTLTD